MGVAARNNLVGNLASTVYNVKRLLGRNFKDPSVQEEQKFLSYNIHEAKGGGVAIKVGGFSVSQLVFPIENFTEFFL
jgi:heat shock 70kDa protein 4